MADTKYYGTGYSALEVIQNFVQTVSESPLKGRMALDEAVKACSSYNSFEELINCIVEDCRLAKDADEFLSKYCGISTKNVNNEMNNK